MDVLHDVRPYHRVKVRLHEVEHQINVLIVLGFQDVEEGDYVGVPVEFLQEDDLDMWWKYLSVGALRIGGVLESVEDFLQGHCLACLLVYCLPDHPVCAFAQLLQDLEPAEDVRL